MRATRDRPGRFRAPGPKVPPRGKPPYQVSPPRLNSVPASVALGSRASSSATNQSFAPSSPPTTHQVSRSQASFPSLPCSSNERAESQPPARNASATMTPKLEIGKPNGSHKTGYTRRRIPKRLAAPLVRAQRLFDREQLLRERLLRGADELGDAARVEEVGARVAELQADQPHVGPHAQDFDVAPVHRLDARGRDGLHEAELPDAAGMCAVGLEPPG